jgi:hypothetical protein
MNKLREWVYGSNFLEFGIRYRSFYSGESSWYHKRLDGHQSRCGGCGEGIKLELMPNP